MDEHYESIVKVLNTHFQTLVVGLARKEKDLPFEIHIYDMRWEHWIRGIDLIYNQDQQLTKIVIWCAISGQWVYENSEKTQQAFSVLEPNELKIDLGELFIYINVSQHPKNLIEFLDSWIQRIDEISEDLNNKHNA